MYHRHFQLKAEPFGVSPDSRFFFQTEQHREALATLYYGISQRRGFALLTGRPGLGKTSVLVQLLQMLEGKEETAYLPQPYFDRASLLEAVLLALGLPPARTLAQSHRLFCEYLMKLRLAGKTCVIVFDEAQELSHDTLEAIRMLSNFETASEKLVQIVLAGQPRLAETLAKPECEQLRQRLNAVARLQPLGETEVGAYMDHRLAQAGASLRLFAPDAVAAVAEASGGVPRNVNTICFNAMTIAFALERASVGREEVAESLRDLDLAYPGPGEHSVTPASPTMFQDAATSDEGCAAEAAGPGRPLNEPLPASQVPLPDRPPASRPLRHLLTAAGVALVAALAIYQLGFLHIR